MTDDVRDFQSAAAEDRRQQINDILARGKVAVFTRPSLVSPDKKVVKKVKEWKEDGEGDLVAFDSTGVTSFVCWESPLYTVTEEDPS